MSDQSQQQEESNPPSENVMEQREKYKKILLKCLSLLLASNNTEISTLIYDLLLDYHSLEYPIDLIYALTFSSFKHYLTMKISSLNNHVNQKLYLNILRKYYLKNLMYDELIILLDEISQYKSKIWCLTERITLLNEAYLCTKKCLNGVVANQQQRNNSAMFTKLLDDLYDRIQLAEIQLTCLQQTNDYNTLNYTLLNIEELYNYSTSHHLYIHCLAILNITPHKDQFIAIIETIWINIIRNCISKNKLNWFESLQLILQDLSLKYSSQSRIMYPLIVIVYQLEYAMIHYNAKQYINSYVIDTLISYMNIPIANLIKIYSTLINDIDTTQMSSIKYAIFKSISYLVQYYSTLAKDKRVYDIEIDQLINKTKTELNVKNVKQLEIYDKLSLMETKMNK